MPSIQLSNPQRPSRRALIPTVLGGSHPVAAVLSGFRVYVAGGGERADRRAYPNGEHAEAEAERRART
jgi:hypothetical protein